MKQDIKHRTDIELLVNSFYDEVKKDGVIGYIFNEIIGDDWSHHLPVMYDFWETVLFGVAAYRGNPVKKHIELDKRQPLQQAHYERWLQLWRATSDTLFEGPKTEEAKKKAETMMQLISIKVEMSRSGKSIL